MKKSLLILLSLAILMSLASLPKAFTFIIEKYSENLDAKLKYPRNGYYYCAELDSYLYFADSKIQFVGADGTIINLRAFTYTNQFVSEDSDIGAWYVWNQSRDSIVLTFEDSFVGIEVGVKYSFEMYD